MPCPDLRLFLDEIPYLPPRFWGWERMSYFGADSAIRQHQAELVHFSWVSLRDIRRSPFEAWACNYRRGSSEVIAGGLEVAVGAPGAPEIAARFRIADADSGADHRSCSSDRYYNCSGGNFLSCSIFGYFDRVCGCCVDFHLVAFFQSSYRGRCRVGYLGLQNVHAFCCYVERRHTY